MRNLDTYWGRDFEVELNDISVREFIAPNLLLVNEQTPVADTQNDLESITADEAYYIMPSADHICGCACSCDYITGAPSSEDDDGNPIDNGFHPYPEHNRSDPGHGHSDVDSANDGPQENGTASTTASVSASGNQGIDGLIGGTRWLDTAITYSDPDSVTDYETNHLEDFNNFSQLTAAQLEAFHFGLNTTILTQNPGAAGFSVSGFTDLDITYAGSGEGAATLRGANTSDPSTAYAYYPSNGVWGGDSFYGNAGDNPVVGNYDWHTVLHELGHALGLAHGHTGGNFGPMPSDIDSLEYSIMTYRTYINGPLTGYSYETFGAPQTFMMYDIAALQYMYGADYTTNNTDTVYAWNPSSGDTTVNGLVAIDPGANRIFATIWDGGGNDTYDLSAYTTDLQIDLAPGSSSLFSTVQQANLGGGVYARGNIFNALQYQGNAASLIENAIGGSGDDIFGGNAADNTFTGNGGTDTVSYAGESAAVTADLTAGTATGTSIGSDTLISIENLSGSDFDDSLTGTAAVNIILAGAGDDTLNGGFGDDTLNGGLGVDTAVFAGVETNYTVLDNADGTLTITDNVGQDGVDLLISVEFAIFAGVTVALPEATGGPTNLTNNDDDYTGTPDDDFINALDGNDTVNGAGGNDTINGGNGNDTIAGGAGADTLDGGEGVDTLSYNGSALAVTVNLETGTGSGGDAEGDIISTFENIFGTGLNDVLTGDSASNQLEGGAGADTFFGGFGNDILMGGDGDDILDGGFSGGSSGSTGSDTINGGAGNDTIIYSRPSSGSSDVDNNDGGDGIDTFVMSQIGFERFVDLTAGIWTLGNISFQGSTRGTLTNIENIEITGSGEVDVRGDALNNVITFTDPNAQNEVQGMAGDDIINAGGGNDLIEGGAGNDTIRGQAGTDTLVVTGNFADYTITDNGDGSFTIVDSVADRDGTDTIVSIEFVEYADGIAAFGASGGDINLTENNDTFTGTAAGETINALGGNDLINAGDGDDIVNGGDGNDNLRGDAGADTLNGGFGADILRGGAGADTLFGGAGADVADYSTSGGAVGVTVNLTTGINTGGDAEGDMLSFIDRVTGSSRPDDITGNARNNYLRGLAGDDVLTGVSGTNLLQGDGGADQHIGGTGTDWAVYVSSAALTVNLLDTTQNTGDAIGDTYSSIENLQGSRNDDSLTGDNANNFIRGDIGDDDLFGLDGDDFLRGDAGADDLFGGTGNDWAYYAASNGAVTIDLSGAVASTGGHAAGDTFDSIERAFGSAFGDSITGTDGANFLRGFFGNDTLSGGDGADLLQGDGGADTLSGGAGSDTASYFSSTATGGLTISLADTSLNTGEAAGDVYNSIENLLGTRFDDILFGDAGDNILRGSLGDDTLNGGGGNDTLRGESGADTFVFEVGGGNDIVIDWSDAEDMLDLSGFGFADVAAVMTNAAQVGTDVVFTIGSDSITIEDTTLALIEDNLIL